MAGAKISKMKSMSIKEPLSMWIKPKKVYIPLIALNDTDITVLVKKDDYVLKGTVIGRKKGDLKVQIHSSVSGKVLDIEECTYLNGNKVKAVVIENDFKEKTVEQFTADKINKYTHQEFIEILKTSGIVGMGGAGFPTYVKYDSNNIKTLVVNAVECEPYITSDFSLTSDKCEEILETIDAILTINKIDKAIIGIKKSNYTLVNQLKNYMGSYLKIKLELLPNIYPMGWERMLVNKATHQKYDRLPSEKGIVVSNISTIYAIYEALKYHKPLIERVVTFSGEGLENPKNILVKIGTKVSDILEELKCKNDKVILVAGGAMMGTSVTDDLVVSPNLNAVLLLPDKEEEPTTTCLRCGRCNEVCPARICPVLIKDAIDNKDKLKKLDVNKCVECGLCSYICPAKINVREYVREAKGKIRD